MIREELEFRIARYADGDLTLAERQAVEAELATDHEARALLAEYQTLRSAIEEAAGPALPKVHWDRLEQLLSAAVANSASAGAAEVEVGGEVEGGAAVEVGPQVEGGAPFVEALGVERDFTVACYADGSLPPERRDEVEQLLAADARARLLFNEYQSLDATIKSMAYRQALPAVRWEQLARHIGSVVEAGAKAVLPEVWERQIAEFAGGALPAADCDAIESRLATEPAARALAYEYANLDAILRAAPGTLAVPDVDWDRFAGRIAAAIERAALQTTERSRKSGNGGSYSILKWLRSPTRMALAASVLLGVTLVTRLMHGRPGPTTTQGPVVIKPVPRIEEIATLKPEEPAGTLVSDISIGPPPLARAGSDDDYAVENGDDDNVVSRPPRAFVASGRTTPNDSEVLPAMPF